MKKISVQNIISFHKKSDKYKQAFLTTINKVRPTNSEGGGNYWVRSISALTNTFKTNDNRHIKDKIDDILTDYKVSKLKQTKDMYQRNLDILHNYENFDFSIWYPNQTFKILDKVSKKSIIEIEKVPVQILPSQVFSFTENKIEYVGAIWFIAKLDGYTKAEFGIFTETLFNYLQNNFSKNFQVNPKHCIVVDVLNLDEVNYQMLINKQIPALLTEALTSIRQNL